MTESTNTSKRKVEEHWREKSFEGTSETKEAVQSLEDVHTLPWTL